MSFPGVMKLLGHNSSNMTMKYLDIALPDLQREFHSARSHPRHLAPQPKTVAGPVRSGIKGVIDSLLATQHALAMFRRTVPNNAARRLLDRLSNRLTKILAELRNLNIPSKMSTDWPFMPVVQPQSGNYAALNRTPSAWRTRGSG